MRLIAKVIRISHAKFYYNRLTAVQGIQYYASVIFWNTVYVLTGCDFLEHSVCMYWLAAFVQL